MCDCENGNIYGNSLDELSSSKLPSPILLNFYKNLEERILWIDFDITEGLIEFENYILKWNKEDKGIDKEDRKPIRIFIYSYGGDVDAIMSFIELIKLSKTPVYTYNMVKLYRLVLYYL